VIIVYYRCAFTRNIDEWRTRLCQMKWMLVVGLYSNVCRNRSDIFPGRDSLWRMNQMKINEPRYEIPLKRRAIFSRKKEQLPYLFVSTCNCLHGYQSFCYDLSTEIFKAVQKYISDTHRFILNASFINLLEEKRKMVEYWNGLLFFELLKETTIEQRYIYKYIICWWNRWNYMYI